MFDSNSMNVIERYISDDATAAEQTAGKNLYTSKILPFFDYLDQIFQKLMVSKTGLSQILIPEVVLRKLGEQKKDNQHFDYSDIALSLIRDESKVLEAIDKKTDILKTSLDSIKNRDFLNSMSFYLLQIYKSMFARFDVVDILTLKSKKAEFVQRNIGRWFNNAKRNGAQMMKEFLLSNIDTTGIDYKKWLFVKKNIQSKKTIYAGLRCEIKKTPMMKWIPLQKSFIVDIDEKALKQKALEKMKNGQKQNYDPYYAMIENFFISGRLSEKSRKDKYDEDIPYVASSKLNYEVGKLWGFEYNTDSDSTFVSLKIFNDQENIGNRDEYGKLLVTVAKDMPTITNAKEYNSKQTNYAKTVSKTIRHYELPAKLKDVTEFDTTFFPSMKDPKDPNSMMARKYTSKTQNDDTNISTSVKSISKFIRGQEKAIPYFDSQIFEHNVAILSAEKFPKKNRLNYANLAAFFSSYTFRVSVLDTDSVGLDLNNQKDTSVLHSGVSFYNCWLLMQFATKNYDNPIPSEKIDNGNFYAIAASTQLTLRDMETAIGEVRQEKTTNYQEMLDFGGGPGEDGIQKDIYVAEKQAIITNMRVKINLLKQQQGNNNNKITV